MKSFCRHCGAELPLSAPRFCSACGAATAVPGTPAETETKSAKAEGAATGCLASWGPAGCLFLIGVLLCLTGVGAFVGVPLIIVALLLPFLGTLMGLGAVKGECPWCGMPVVGASAAKGIDCPACKKRIVIKDRKFIRID